MTDYAEIKLGYGRCNYEAYREAMSSRDTNGNPLPTWGDLLPRERDAWVYAADQTTDRFVDRNF